jgi:hypothetical protein
LPDTLQGGVNAATPETTTGAEMVEFKGDAKSAWNFQRLSVAAAAFMLRK